MLFRILRSESRCWFAAGVAAVALTLVGGHSDLSFAAAAGSSEASCCRTERPGDEVWLICCRQLPCFSRDNPPPADVGDRLSYRRYDWESKKWRRLDEGAFLATERLKLPTTFWVHEDRAEPSVAYSRGWYVYQQLVRGGDVEAMRFVIWSWPATKEIKRRPVQDAQIKAFRVYSAGYYLGWVLNRLEPTTRVGLMGFSFGARVVTGSLHALAGGEILGHALPDAGKGPMRRHNAVLMGAALDDDWLLPGRPHGMAITQVEKLLLQNNCRDWILKRYPKLCGRAALGYVGLHVGGALAPYADRIRQINAGRYIGIIHALRPYINSQPLMALTRKYVLVDLLLPAAVSDDS